jgi:negative regulator of flagellin synthesis FlgM
MDIREIQSSNTGATEASRRSRGTGGAGSTPPVTQSAETSSDSVALSGQAQALQQVRRAALEVPEVRQDRVTEIRDQVSKGALVLDPSRIARALLEQNVLG